MLGLAIWILASAPPAMAERDPPYWASIDKPKARMRTGPSTEYPITWIYKRKNLPIKIVARYRSWRKVEDPGGTQGWIHAGLLSGSLTAMVTGQKGQVRTLHAKPDEDAKIIWHVEAGVVGKISRCENGWCLFDVDGRRGYINQAVIWGGQALE